MTSFLGRFQCLADERIMGTDNAESHEKNICVGIYIIIFVAYNTQYLNEDQYLMGIFHSIFQS